MALSVNDVSQLQEYIAGVMNRADHHARNVDEIVLALTGAIVWMKDDAPIKVMAQAGAAKNVLWVQIRGNRYAFSYNHESTQIEMRSGSTQGAVLHAFDNGTTAGDVKQIFEGI